VHRATDRRQAIATLVRAFRLDPAARWLFPDDDRYVDDFSAFARAFGGRAFEEESAFATETLAGVALWFAPDAEPDEEAIVSVIDRAVPLRRLDDAYEVFGQMEQFHPSFPHWYLPLIGVDPQHQGKGIGSALLRHTLERCDRSGLPAYLESSSPANLPLYERHGFRVIGEIQAGQSPVIYPMLRSPLVG
jgi:ribosomal protein S18 acetylase RimI-like enzyme